MNTDSDREDMREMVQEEMKKFAQEFLPGMEETIRFMEKVNLMENQIEGLEVKMGNVKNMLQSSITHLEDLAKAVQGASRGTGGNMGTIGEAKRYAPRDGSIYAKKRDFIEEIERINRGERDFIERLGLTSNSPTSRRKKNVKRSKVDFEKRILRLESEQVKVQQLLENKLDAMIREVRRASGKNKNKNKGKVGNIEMVIGWFGVLMLCLEGGGSINVRGIVCILNGLTLLIMFGLE